QRHAGGREGETGGPGRGECPGAESGRGVEQVDDDRAVHPRRGAVQVEAQLRVGRRDAGDGQRDVEGVGDVVVGEGRRAGGGGEVRRHLLVAVQRGGQAGGVAAQVDRHGGGEGAVVDGVGAGAAVEDAGAQAGAVGQRQRVVAALGVDVDGGRRDGQGVQGGEVDGVVAVARVERQRRGRVAGVHDRRAGVAAQARVAVVGRRVVAERDDLVAGEVGVEGEAAVGRGQVVADARAGLDALVGEAAAVDEDGAEVGCVGREAGDVAELV